MYAMNKQTAGFTILELCVCMIIVGILGSMALLYYEQAMENVRRADMLSLLGTEIAAQDRYHLIKGRYTKYWHELDVAPVQVRYKRADNPYADPENKKFYSRGKKSNGEPRSGFEVYFEQFGQNWFMVGQRVPEGDKYQYTLVRPFNADRVYCIPKTEKDEVICLNVMGLDDVAELPADPRLVTDLDDSED